MRNNNEDGEIGNVLHVHEENLMGIPLILYDSAIEVEHEGSIGIVVPDLKALEASAAVARAVIPVKLSGQEIRFLRKAMETKASELARFLDVVPETFSRWENDKEVITTNAERLLRLRVLQHLKDRAVGVTAKDSMVLDMKISPMRASVEPLSLAFKIQIVRQGDDLKETWCYIGTNQERQDTEVRLLRA
jgi:DNA-binding transcriptional regulator YiaG